jgi:rifampicin phosphotransferase
MAADPPMNAETPTALNQATDPERFGQKAATLGRLRSEGHDVPDGFVIPVGGDRSIAALRGALARLGAGPWAVRSSGVAEDGVDSSFAGQFQTVLGAKTAEEVAAAAERVVASAQGRTPMAVLVQSLIQPTAAGVLFTRNPTNGDDELVIEAVAGLADQLVDGAVAGERWVVVGDVATRADGPSVLQREDALRLARLGRSLAAQRGAPQDIEWAMTGEQIHLLQARPITSLPLKPEISFPPGRWVKDQSHFTGPVTPIAATVLLPAYEKGIEGMCPKFGLPMKTIRQRAFGGEVYTQDTDLAGNHDPSAAPPWWVLGLVFRLLPSLRRCNAVAANAHALLEELPRKWEETWREECDRRVLAARDVDLLALDDAALVAEMRRVIDEILVPHLGLHFDLTVPHVAGLYELHLCCRDALGWDEGQTLELLTGLSTSTTRATRELEAIAAALDDATLDGTLADVRRSPVGPRMDGWLRHWGLRTIDVDPGAPMTSEREDLVMVMLREARRPKVDPVAVEADRQRRIREARAAMNPSHHARFNAALEYAELVYPQRDDNVPYTEGFPCGLVRRVLLEMGRRLTDRGQLRSREDAAFLELDELGPALAGSLDGETASERVRRRRAEFAWVSAHPGPAVVGPPVVPDPDIRGLPAPIRRMMEVLLWAMKGELAPPAGGADGDGLRGVAVSPGTYTGPVRVVRTEAELHRLRPGEVLVCPTTHSSWTVAFGHAGALVADGGGMLAHPAIIAREHGIPAVLATVEATKRLRDGQIVTVDGSAGRVRIH